jgi:putative ABC transport system substrate-binding protein
MNNRRKLLVALGAGALATPISAWAQTQKVHRIGILFASSKSHPGLQAFMQEFRRLGYVEGQNVAIVNRLADGKLDRLPAFAAELVAERVDVIFAPNTPTVQAARQAAGSIPIVFSIVSDPVGSGFVASLGRPGGNITGTTSLHRELSAKRLQILKEIFPRTSRVAVLTTNEPQVAPMVEQVQQAAKLLGITILTTQMLSRDDLDSARKLLRTWRADSIYIIATTGNFLNRKLLAEFAAELRLPAVWGEKEYMDAGGLISYGANYDELYRRAAQYVDKILKGAKPADLPVEQPTRFEMIINMKTAKALGIKIPNSIMVRVEKVIE